MLLRLCMHLLSEEFQKSLYKYNLIRFGPSWIFNLYDYRTFSKPRFGKYLLKLSLCTYHKTNCRLFITFFIPVCLQSSAWLALVWWCFSSVSCSPSLDPSTTDTPTGNHSGSTVSEFQLNRVSYVVYKGIIWVTKADIISMQSYCIHGAEIQAKTRNIHSKYSFDFLLETIPPKYIRCQVKVPCLGTSLTLKYLKEIWFLALMICVSLIFLRSVCSGIH